MTLKRNLWSLYSPKGGCAMTVTVQGNFQRILQFFLFMSAQVFVSAQNTPKITLHGSPSEGLTGSSGAILQIIGTSISFYKMHIFKTVLL